MIRCYDLSGSGSEKLESQLPAVADEPRSAGFIRTESDIQQQRQTGRLEAQAHL